METHVYFDGLSPRDLKDQLHQLVAIRRQSLWLICRYLADLADRGGHGYDDIYVYAWCELAMPLRRTQERIRVGRALRALPAIEASFVAGKVGFARVREIVRVATPETEHLWLEAARYLPRRLLEARVAEAGGRRPPPEDDDSAPEADLSADEDVTVRLPASIWRRLRAVLLAAKETGGPFLSDREALELVLAKAEVALGNAVPNLGDGEADRNDSLDDPTGTQDTDAEPAPDLGDTEEQPGAAVPMGTAHEDGGGEPHDGGTAGFAPLRPGDPMGTWDGTAVPACDEAEAGPEAMKLLKYMRVFGETRLDEAGRAAGMDGSELVVALARLELAGFLRLTFHGYRLVRCQAGDE